MGSPEHCETMEIRKKESDDADSLGRARLKGVCGTMSYLALYKMPPHPLLGERTYAHREMYRGSVSALGARWASFLTRAPPVTF